ncbi:MAG: type I-E CRISPR-associated endoribonuclease Cas2 [Chloroflexi bacterium]|jgi:CRISPR-associated protein Cas2|nr:type I-E CRISPR-associated endoribonuclease Cas2 [Chloroflexota bacterium]
MLVMILKRVTPALRGELSRWLLEPQAGVFVGDVSARVRDKLWIKCKERKRGGAVLQVWTTDNEQGFRMRLEGDLGREIVEADGLQLIRKPKATAQE